MKTKELKVWLEDKGVTLVAVSKKKPVEDIMDLYEQGQRDFGENRVSELVRKKEQLPDDIRWHMVGHLQSKKTKHIADFVYMIQSVDSLSLCKKIDKYGRKHDRVIKVLLQIKIAEEYSKYGYGYQDLLSEMPALLSLSHVEFCGVMGMGTLTDDNEVTRTEFCQLADYFHALKEGFFADIPSFRHISMGMSGDYRIAVDCGSTMVRIGSLIFGPRD